MPRFSLTSYERPPTEQEINPLLDGLYGGHIERMAKLGVDVTGPAEISIIEFWESIQDYLPPKGCLFIAKTADGEPVGCGMLKALTVNSAELKRLFVKPNMRGSGLGQALVQVRIERAKEMGFKEVLVDTLSTSIEMHKLYEKMGFEDVSEFDNSTSVVTTPDLIPHLKAYRMAL